jgi:hypothetical protein
VPAEYRRPVGRPGSSQIDRTSGPRKYTFLYRIVPESWLWPLICRARRRLQTCAARARAPPPPPPAAAAAAPRRAAARPAPAPQ